MRIQKPVAKAAVVAVLLAGVAAPQVGLFESRGDLGVTPRIGAISYDAATGEYAGQEFKTRPWSPDSRKTRSSTSPCPRFAPSKIK